MRDGYPRYAVILRNTQAGPAPSMVKVLSRKDATWTNTETSRASVPWLPGRLRASARQHDESPRDHGIGRGLDAQRRARWALVRGQDYPRPSRPPSASEAANGPVRVPRVLLRLGHAGGQPANPAP